jgi:hypothetical protein
MKPLLPAPLPLFTFLFSLFTAALCAASPSFSPLQIGINSPFHTGPGGDELQLVSPETAIIGLRLNLPLACNHDVAGLDVGLFSYACNFSGIRLNLQSWTHKTVRGVDVSLIAMMAEESEFDGIQIAGLGIAHHIRGIQAGLVTYGDIRGVQIGLWNTAIDLRGLQIGLFNDADNVYGLQIGLVNSAESPPRGLQIGLLNIAPSSAYPYLPLLRASF